MLHGICCLFIIQWVLPTKHTSPFVQSRGSVWGHLCPGGLYGCCRWASAGTDHGALTSSYRKSRTPQIPKCPGCHQCLPPKNQWWRKTEIEISEMKTPKSVIRSLNYQLRRKKIMKWKNKVKQIVCLYMSHYVVM